MFKVISYHRTPLNRQIKEAIRIRRRGGATEILNSRSEYNRCHIPRLVVEVEEEGIRKAREQKEEEEIKELIRSLESEDLSWEERKKRERELAVKKRRRGSEMDDWGAVEGATIAGGRRKTKRLKYSRLEENWGEHGGIKNTTMVEQRINDQKTQKEEGNPDPDRPTLMIRSSKRKVPPVTLRSSTIPDYFKVMRTIEEVLVEEEECDQNVNSHDQVETTASQEQVADREEDTLVEQEDDQKKKEYSGNTRPDRGGYDEGPDHTDQEDPFGNTSDQEDFEDHILTINKWTDQEAMKYFAMTKPGVHYEDPDQPHDQEGQQEYTENRVEDDQDQMEDDLEMQFILESSWFEDTTLSLSDHQEDDLQIPPDNTQKDTRLYSTIPDQVEDKREYPDSKDASTVSISGNSLADFGARPTAEHAGENRINHVINEHPFVYDVECAPTMSVDPTPVEMTPLEGLKVPDIQRTKEAMFHHNLPAARTSTPEPSVGYIRTGKLSQLQNTNLATVAPGDPREAEDELMTPTPKPDVTQIHEVKPQVPDPSNNMNVDDTPPHHEEG